MSLREVRASFLTLGPKVWRDGERLHIRTSTLVQVATLFLRWRAVAVDPQRRRVEVETRTAWFLASRRAIPFDDVEHLDYQYRELPTSWSWLYGATDSIERYTIDLVLRDGERVRVAAVTGEGSVSTGLGGVVFGGDDLIDARGAQQERSLGLVDQLSALIGAPLGRPFVSDGNRGSTTVCSACNRHVPASQSSCQYCGGAPTTVRL